MSEQNSRIFEFGPFRLDPSRRLLLRDGEAVKLFPKEFDTLLALVESSGEELHKDELMRKVWGETIVEESNLAKNISHLRKILGEKPNQHQYIVTIPGEGYRFVAGVRTAAFDEVSVQERRRTELVIEEDANGGHGDTENLTVTARPLVSKSPRHRVSLPAVFATAFVLVAASLAVFFAVSQRSRSERQKVVPLLTFQQTDIKRLAINGDPRIAVLSPDGKLFAYVLNDGELKRSLWLGHVDGGQPIELRPPSEVFYPSLTFAPDGSSLYFTASDDISSRGALYMLPVFGGVPRKVKDDVRNRISFSPDGKQFAYIRGDGVGSVLVIADITGTTIREIASHQSDLGFSTQSHSWSPDGTMIAVGASKPGRQDAEIFVVQLADGTLKPLTNSAWKEVPMTGWLNDSSGLIAVASDKRSGWDAQLWHVSYPDGEARRVVTDLTTYNYSANLSADSKSLLAVRGQHQSNIWLAHAENLSNAKQITFDLLGRNNGWNGLDWTPDGRVVFTASADVGQTLWIADANGDNKKQLVPSGDMNLYPSVTDEGRYVVFQSDRSGSTEIWRANLDGSDLRQLTTGGRNSQPHVSSDGKWVVYKSIREHVGSLWRIAIDGGEATQLTYKTTSWPRVSPDGKLIACVYGGKLAILSAQDGRPIKLFEVPRLANFNNGLRWTPEGKAVTYRDWANGIWKQALNGGEPQRISGLPQEKLYGYGWSRDGMLFAFTRGAELRDLVLIRDLR